MTRPKLHADEGLAPAFAFLAQRGVVADPVSGYDEDDVRRAIRSRGWEADLVAEPGGWQAKIREWRAPTQSQVAIAYESDRLVALLGALRVALTWPSPEEEARHFDEQAQALMGMSATEFLQKWQNNELTADDPRVVHLLILRPLGW